MGLSIEEQEFNILHMRGEDNVEMYISDTLWMRKLDKLVETAPKYYKLVNTQYANGEVVGKTYTFPIKLLTFRRAPFESHMTEEQRQAASERFKKMLEEARAAKNAGEGENTEEES